MASTKSDTWMPLYVGDYLRDTQRLTTVGHGAYLLLIMDYWTSGPLPDDDEQLSAIVKMAVRDWKKLRPKLAEFFDISDGRWLHKRIEIEIERASSLVEARSAAGKLGGRPKKQTESKPKANEKQTETPSPSPSPLKEETIVSSKDAIVDDEILKFVADHNLPVDPAEQLERFNDWKLAKGRKFRNDRAAFRNWLRKAADIAREHPHSLGSSKSSPAPISYSEPWEQRMRGWHRSQFWDVAWGPRPGQNGCRVPPELLSEKAA